MLYSIYLFSYMPLILFSCAVWLELKDRPEFGERPKILMRSLLIMTAAGAVSVLILRTGEEDATAKRLLLTSAVYPLFLIGLYLLESSVHSQRIKKSFLLDDHNRVFKPALYAMWLLALVSIASIISMLLIIFGVKIDMYALGNNAGFIASIAVFITAFYIIIRVFNFQEGLIRKKNYPFVVLAVAIILVNFSYAITGGDNSAEAAGLISIFVLSVYVYRMYQEYFFFRLFHVNDLLSKQESSNKLRNRLINRSIVSTVDQDIEILSELLKTMLDRTTHELPLPQYRITGLALYRLNNGRFRIDNTTLIRGYCAPLTKFDAIKRSSEEQVKKLNIDTIFDSEAILSAGLANASGFAEEAVYKMLSENEPVYIDPLPAAYRGVVKMMALYPIVNNDNVTGFFLLEKDSFDKLFPQEITVLSDVSDSINTLFSIMHGKEVQEERNRLEGEMNIAKDIQTSIVPKEINIPGYETACSMSTATEVGGDAYDNANTEFGNYFTIGDVSGHGLPSGIMALIQITAFQTALETSKILKRELRISEVYDIINRILCTINRDRIGSDKFMTGNVFVEKEGTIHHAGTHEIALLYKKETNSVIQISGTTDKTAFLGLSELVVSTQSEGLFKMESGDVLLLYTDGAIEAKNDSGTQFGIQRLADDLKLNASIPLNKLLETLEKNIRSYAKNGDIRKNSGNMADDLSFVCLRKQ